MKFYGNSAFVFVTKSLVIPNIEMIMKYCYVVLRRGNLAAYVIA